MKFVWSAAVVVGSLRVKQAVLALFLSAWFACLKLPETDSAIHWTVSVRCIFFHGSYQLFYLYALINYIKTVLKRASTVTSQLD